MFAPGDSRKGRKCHSVPSHSFSFLSVDFIWFINLEVEMKRPRRRTQWTRFIWSREFKIRCGIPTRPTLCGIWLFSIFHGWIPDLNADVVGIRGTSAFVTKEGDYIFGLIGVQAHGWALEVEVNKGSLRKEEWESRGS
jgi:hypothetical protein